MYTYAVKKYPVIRILVSGDYILLLMREWNRKYPFLLIEKISRLTSTPGEDPPSLSYGGSRTDTCGDICTSTNTFVLKPGDRQTRMPWDNVELLQVQSRSGDVQGRFRAVFSEGDICNVYPIELPDTDTALTTDTTSASNRGRIIPRSNSRKYYHK